MQGQCDGFKDKAEYSKCLYVGYDAASTVSHWQPLISQGHYTVSTVILKAYMVSNELSQYSIGFTRN